MNRSIRISLYIIFSLGLATLLYATPRESFLAIAGIFAILFLIYGILVRKLLKSAPTYYQNLTFEIFWVGIMLRIVASIALPELSDDYFRFIWDGRILAHGESPFERLPADYIQEPAIAETLGLDPYLFERLNSPQYFTIYPPLNQFVFFLGAWLFPHSIYGSVMIMKLFLLLAEVGTLYLLLKLLKCFHLPTIHIAWYAYNPLVIAELVGNLHFEAMMIFFVLLSIWFLWKEKWVISSLCLGLAVASKLLPLMFLPLFLKRLGFWRTAVYSMIAIGITIILFIPLLNIETVLHLWSSIELYFQKFEFNASIYYIVRWIGYQVKGYNIIQLAGKWLALATLVSIFMVALVERDLRVRSLPKQMLWALSIYFAFASIVHPWYTSTLVALCVLTPFRFPVIWTSLLPLTYIAYRSSEYKENLYIVAFIYMVVYGIAIYELLKGSSVKSRISEPY